MTLKFIQNIGNGGFGVVDLVEDEDGNKHARKTFQINQGPSFPKNLEDNVKKRFVREANVQETFNHRNIVPVINKNLRVDPPYFLMPLALGSLDQVLRMDRTVGGNFLSVILDIMAGLEELHAIRIYHRDLKPGNVLRFSDTEGDYYAISDFGLMSIDQTQISALTQAGMKMGSDYYTAPEIVKDLKNASVQSDIYSLGCILHDMVGTEDRVPCLEIKEEGHYAGILRNCTRTDRDRRFKSVDALRSALLSIGEPDTKPETKTGENVLDLLFQERNLSKEEWETIVSFIEDNVDSHDGVSSLKAISLEKLDDLLDNNKTLGVRLGAVFANWVRNGSFVFGYCDGLAIRLEKLMEKTPGEIDLHVDCLMAMLYMGTSHNRWLVEQKFVRLTASNMNDSLARRLEIEIRTDEEDACYAMRHLVKSINFSLINLHPRLYQAFQDVCR